jgi:phosphatidylglycerophosphate synthase
MLRYDYTFQKDIPNWCFLFAGLCVWIYSTLDAVDGKQARRTKSSSPLGQLFDHGCDSFSITFFVLALGQAAKLEGLEIFVLFVACQSAFWSSNWI